jgi:hypothetical protein
LNDRHADAGDVNAHAALMIDEDLKAVHTIKAVNMNELSRETKGLTTGRQALSNLLSSSPPTVDQHLDYARQFAQSADQIISELLVLLNATQVKCSELTKFFGEEAGTPIQHMMSLLAEFMTGFSKSKVLLEKKLKKERSSRSSY